MTTIRFAVASCQYPGGLLDKEPAYRAYGRLGGRLKDIALLLLVGDQVYVDATAGLFDPTVQADRFHRPYKVLYGQPRVALVGSSLDGVYCMMDDHELEDNWEPIAGRPDPNLPVAVGAYKTWERAQGPAYGTKCRDQLWFEIARPPVQFFVADTRTERTPRNAMTVADARIMGDCQYKELCRWLEACDSAAPKVIACPSILLPRRRWAAGHPSNALRSDAWDGYRRSLHGLLAFIADKSIPNVIFVSGDEHIPCIARITLRCMDSGKGTLVRSIHSSPLYAPYPFANSVREDLIGSDHFQFSDPDDQNSRYDCTVETCFPDCGNGFAIVSLSDSIQGWQVSCEFCGENQTPSNDCLAWASQTSGQS